jgi:hypothetical protein
MRTQYKNRQRAMRRKATAFRTQKAAVFLIAFFFVIGLVTVDEAYSEMMGQESNLCLQTRRLDEEIVSFALLGQEVKINVSLVQRGWKRMEEEVEDVLDDIFHKSSGLPFEGKIL